MRFARPPHDSIIKRTAKKIRENSYDVETAWLAQCTAAGSAAIQSRNPSGSATSMRLALMSIRTQNSAARGTKLRLVRFYCQQRDAAREFDIADRAHRRSGPCFPHFASNQLADVIVPGSSFARCSNGICTRIRAALGSFHRFNAGKMKDACPPGSSKASIADLHAPGCAPASASHTSLNSANVQGNQSGFRRPLRAKAAWAQNSRQGTPVKVSAGTLFEDFECEALSKFHSRRARSCAWISPCVLAGQLPCRDPRDVRAIQERSPAHLQPHVLELVQDDPQSAFAIASTSPSWGPPPLAFAGSARIFKTMDPVGRGIPLSCRASLERELRRFFGHAGSFERCRLAGHRIQANT